MTGKTQKRHLMKALKIALFKVEMYAKINSMPWPCNLSLLIAAGVELQRLRGIPATIMKPDNPRIDPRRCKKWTRKQYRGGTIVEINRKIS